MIDAILLRAALRDLIRAKRVVLAIILIAIPTLLAFTWRVTAPEDFDPGDVYHTLAKIIVYGFILVILSLVFGTGALAQEIEQKTIIYLLTRPVARARILLMKYLAAVIMISVIASVSLGGLALACFGVSRSSTTALIRRSEINNPVGFLLTLKADERPIGKAIRDELSNRGRTRLANLTEENADLPEMLFIRVIRGMNDFIRAGAIESNKAIFEGVDIAGAGATPQARTRLALQAAYPDFIQPPKDRQVNLMRDLAVIPVGALAYTAMFLLLATLLNRPLMWGLMLSFGWEQLIPNMPGSFQKLSIMTYLRVLAPHEQPPAESVDLLQFLAGQAAAAPPTAMRSWITLAVVTIAFLGASLYLFTTQEFVPRDDAE